MNKVSNRFLVGIMVGLFCILTTPYKINAQDCNCDHVLTASDDYVDANNLGVQPGDIICIEGGQRSHLGLLNFQGTADQPLIFKNCGGKAVFENNTLGYAIKFQNSRHFKLTGTGDPNHEYGIKIAGTKDGSSGLQIGDLSSDFEVEFLEITNVGFAGIMAKTDFRCDGSANRDNFYMRNVRIHDNNIHDIGGEGLYIGNSFYSGRTKTCNGQEVTLYPHDIIGLRVYNNVVKNTGWDGIQIGCASEDTKIFNNEVINYGQSGSDAHTNGIQIGEGTTGEVYNNLIKDGTGNGIIALGLGNNLFYNNLIIRPGGYGIFCDDRVTEEGSEMAFINNTLIDPAKGGILNYNEVTENKYYNNIITGSNGNISFGEGATGDLKNNIVDIILSDPVSTLDGVISTATRTKNTTSTVGDSLFMDFQNDDFRIQEESPAVNAGKDVISFGIDFDHAGNVRPAEGSYDVGAFEAGSIPKEEDPDPEPEPNDSTSTDPGQGKEENTILYRVNNGGVAVEHDPVTWKQDKQKAPTSYLDAESSNNTTGSDSWSGTNNTGAPDNIFGSNRYDGDWGGPLKLNFPVEEGQYEVRLYFAEKPGGINAAGERVFDVTIEEQTVLQDLDIYKEAGMDALQEEFQVEVNDGTLNIGFIRKINDPQVNGIEILAGNEDSVITSINNTGIQGPSQSPFENIKIYPNPFIDQLSLEANTKIDSIIIYDHSGRLVYKNQSLNGQNILPEKMEVDLSSKNLPSGLYIIRVLGSQDGRSYSQSFKLLKE